MSQRKEPLRILHIIDSLNVGGTERQCVETVKRINSSSYLIYLVTLNKEGPLYNELIDSGIPLTEFKIASNILHPRSILQILRLASFMKKKKFHIVQTYGFYSTMPGVIAAKLANVPVIIVGKRDMNEKLSRIKIIIEKILWMFCDKIIVNAKAIQDYLIAKEDIPKSKIKVIYNGVDLRNGMNVSQIDNHMMIKIVGMVAVFRGQKDHKTLLESAVRVRKEIPDIRFALVGSGPLEEDMKKYARQLNLHDIVTFYGRKTGKELYEIMNSFTISVLSSTNEGIPNVILESMAFGIPVISNPSGGVPELIEDGVTGYLFPYKRDDILAKKILHLLENKNIAIEMSKRGREKVRRGFSMELMCKQFENIYDSLLQRK